VKAFVVARPGAVLAEADLIDHCKRHLGQFQCPGSVEIVATLPRNTGGKILKTELRKPYWERQRD
jgi:long-chain acyl-CoA synthetase